ncbi:MAG: sulfatase-like hydrolase/transferase, partial [Akkermansia sp.]
MSLHHSFSTALIALGALFLLSDAGAKDATATVNNATKAKAPKAIIFIFADDLGYGDIGCNGAKAIPTPAIDKLSRQGLRFTDAYSTSAVCTPSRYALLTGEYPWRKEGTGILPGDAALIIDPTRNTLPKMLQQYGYKTAVMGKWHLGLGKGKIDWNKRITPGPNEIGFDESYIFAATGDRVP